MLFVRLSRFDWNAKTTLIARSGCPDWDSRREIFMTRARERLVSPNKRFVLSGSFFEAIRRIPSSTFLPSDRRPARRGGRLRVRYAPDTCSRAEKLRSGKKDTWIRVHEPTKFWEREKKKFNKRSLLPAILSRQKLGPPETYVCPDVKHESRRGEAINYFGPLLRGMGAVGGGRGEGLSGVRRVSRDLLEGYVISLKCV